MPDLKPLFEPACESPPRKHRVGATTESIALIANNGGTGVILEYDGSGIEASIEGVGKALDDNGLDDAPDGLSIWEGAFHTWKSWTNYGYDYDAELRGTFRPLTEDEWRRLSEGEPPWLFEP